MVHKFKLHIEWLSASSGNEAEKATFGALTFRVGEALFTDVIDLLAQTPRHDIYVSMNRMAHWFAENWWRLRWEPVPSGEMGVDWKMAHQLAAAGGGFVWPPVSFASDGKSVMLHSKPTTEDHTIRYIRGHEVACSAATFEDGIDEFLTAVLARQEGMGAVDADLRNTWDAVLEERRDPEASKLRKREALLGLNPGDIDVDRLDELFSEGAWIGDDALDETLTIGTSDGAEKLLSDLSELRQRNLDRWSFERVFEASKGWQAGSDDEEAWQKGVRLAADLRRTWGLGEGPVTDEFLRDLVRADIHEEFKETLPTTSVAFRDGDQVMPALWNSRYKANRRFAVARLIADAAIAPATDALFPLTRTLTARQKMQRSAAQEFLCPAAELKKRLTFPNPDDEEIAEAAEYFQVSEKLVTTTLVNKKLVSRSYLGEMQDVS